MYGENSTKKLLNAISHSTVFIIMYFMFEVYIQIQQNAFMYVCLVDTHSHTQHQKAWLVSH